MVTNVHVAKANVAETTAEGNRIVTKYISKNVINSVDEKSQNVTTLMNSDLNQKASKMESTKNVTSR